MPYTIGADILPEEKEELKQSLEQEEEKRLTADIMDLYDRLLPSAESDDRRRQLVAKLEKLFNEQWPGYEIKAHVFGSSGNKLCSSDSDGTWELASLGILDIRRIVGLRTDSSSGHLYHDKLQ